MQKFERDIFDILTSYKSKDHMKGSDVIDAIEEYIEIKKIEIETLIFSEDFKAFIFEAAVKRNAIDKKYLANRETKTLNELEIY